MRSFSGMVKARRHSRRGHALGPPRCLKNSVRFSGFMVRPHNRAPTLRFFDEPILILRRGKDESAEKGPSLAVPYVLFQ